MPLSPDVLSALLCSASANNSLCGPVSAAPFIYLLTVSTPPATKQSPSPAFMAWAAIRIVCNDDEQYRFTVTPGTSISFMTAIIRPILKPPSPPGCPMPQIMSSTSAGSSPSTLPRTSLTINADMSSGLASTRLPLEARPIGVRDVATITGSAMLTPHMY